MVQVRKGKRDGLHAQTFEPRNGRGDIAAGVFHCPKRKG